MNFIGKINQWHFSGYKRWVPLNKFKGALSCFSGHCCICTSRTDILKNPYLFYTRTLQSPGSPQVTIFYLPLKAFSRPFKRLPASLLYFSPVSVLLIVLGFFLNLRIIWYFKKIYKWLVCSSIQYQRPCSPEVPFGLMKVLQQWAWLGNKVPLLFFFGGGGIELSFT